MNWLTCLLFSCFLLLVASGADANNAVPCSFPEKCSCELRNAGTKLWCKGMQNCFSQAGMDALGASMNPVSCPVKMVTLSCNRESVWPIVEITSELFRHEQWRRLEELYIGTSCKFVFREKRVLSNLPNLKSFSLRNNDLSANLGEFSEIFCCPKGLSEILIDSLGAEQMGTRFGQRSFLKLNALKKFTVIRSPKLFDRLEFVLNTSSPAFSFHWHGKLPHSNKEFSNLLFTNLASRSSLELLISDGATQLELDSPAQLSGFDFTRLDIQNTRLSRIGDAPFRNFTLKDISITAAGLNEIMLPQLLRAIAKVKNPLAVRTLALEFNYKKRGFPYDEFNALCKALPLLRRLSLSHSSVSFGQSEQYFDCPQLFLLSITNCNLQDEDIPPRAFDKLTRLENIRLINNQLSRVPKDLLRNLSQITYLDLSHNRQLKLKASSFRGILPSLQTLRLTQTGYTEPLTDAFVDQSNLTELHLNKLVELRSTRCPFRKTWFKNCSKLKTLNLAGDHFLNYGECHGGDFFDPLTSLESLSISSCDFGHQSDGTIKALLSKLSTLKTLMASGNQLARLEFFLNRKFENLNLLDVSWNSFSSIPVDLIATTTPALRNLELMEVPLANIDPKTFDKLPKLRLRLGRNQFRCACNLLPFADWLREQWPVYQLESKGDWLLNAICYTASNSTKRVIDFRLSWWDCYSRRLIFILSASIGGLLILFILTALLLRYRWKLRYTILAFGIRNGIVNRKQQNEWTYDACFIYDETDSSVSEWAGDLVLKLETDLRLRLYEAERDAPVGSNMLDEAASAIDKSRHAVLVLSRGFLENRLNLYSAQWSSESLFMRRRSLAVLVMREKLSESELRFPECKVLHRLYRMCKRDRIVDCSGCGVGSNSANRLGLLLYDGADVSGRSQERRAQESETESDGAEAAGTKSLLSDD
ncbi:hypothetical protein BOX15_Mlig015196g2 [Macrostomum lignano]|uniref:TIR domain-containing protein n=1 Tax=Macrostomum lignano TaxID=282301 RepID=A0A267H7K3_9PLAT|nr:hypothetical protein BOX15_Mlig015196g2 [Macrostomum lignano]